jgi:hypothetical protein
MVSGASLPEPIIRLEAFEVVEVDSEHGRGLDKCPVIAQACIARTTDKTPSRCLQRRACRHLVGELLATSTMSNKPTDSESKWSLESGTLGEPRLFIDGSRSTIQVSIAHSRDCLAVALSRHSRIGIDIEAIRPRKNLHEIAEFLGWGGQVDNLDEFLERWTLWEACVKLERSSIFSPFNQAFDVLSRLEEKSRMFGSAPWVAVRPRRSREMHSALVLQLDGPHTLRVRNRDPETLAPLAADDLGPACRVS